jgi:signal peptidase I
MRGHQPDILRLFEDILRSGTSLRVRVTGRSMTPFLRGGEVLTIRRTPCVSLRKGDLILYRDKNDLPVLHRIINKQKGDNGTFRFLAKGDAVVIPDEPVGDKDILGKVCIVEYGPKHINLESRRWGAVNYLLAAISLLEARIHFILRTVKHLVRSDRMRGHVNVP